MKIPVAVGLLPGVLYSWYGDRPVIFSMESEMACLAQLYVEKFTTRTAVTLASGGRAPDAQSQLWSAR